MKTFAIKGKKYRWNPKASPLYVPVTLLALVMGILCFYILGAAMCAMWTEPAAPTAREALPQAEQLQPTNDETPAELISLGVFQITYYCREQYPHICNAGEPYKTATGTTPTAGRTVAVDPSVIPYGTEVVIDGHTYVAEDCGGAVNGNHIDLVVDTHQEALEKGRHTAEVFIRKGEKK